MYIFLDIIISIFNLIELNNLELSSMSAVLAERSFHCLIDYGKELIVCWFQFE